MSAVIGVIQFQGFVGVGFSSQPLFDAGKIEMLEGEGVLGGVSVEGRGGHQSDRHHM